MKTLASIISNWSVTTLLSAALCGLTVASVHAAEPHVLHTRVHDALANLTPTGRLSPTNRLHLVIGLPVRNQADLDLFLKQLYDPASPNFHRYLTPAQYTARFGPTEAEYQAVVNFATAQGLRVDRKDESREILDVSAMVPDIERAFHVTLRTYQHPTEPRPFYAPDVEATVDAALPILSVSGMDNFVIPHPMSHPMPNAGTSGSGGGSAGGFFRGFDFRNAYASNVNNLGAGQNIGLVEEEGFYNSDITTYETQAGLPNVPLQIVYTDVLNAGNSPNQADTNGVGECSLDIEMTISMAPGMNTLYVFEGQNTDDILGAMAANTQILQFSTSWGMGQDAKAETLLQRMQTQGQSFFSASGDGDAYVYFPIPWPSDDPNLVSVGGTTLAMSGAGKTYNSEAVWNSGYLGGPPNIWFSNGRSGWWGSGGGVSSSYPIPSWQQGVNLSAVGGSTTQRNIPDVSMTANQVWVNYESGLSGPFIGTSCAAPLWAGFTALVNEQAASNGLPPVGFLNPAFYIIGQSPGYTNAFHDITVSNSFWAQSPNNYSATSGYDLCTGWGTPNGQALVNALLQFAGQTWVNFSATSCPGNGTFTNAFCTLASGTSAVAPNGTVCLIGPNSSSVTPTISSPMTLRSFFGPVTIGQQ